VAAILTVIGYSINDTVIIFDRIREFINFGSSHDRKQIFNDAINSTLSRTLITSGTTLIVVVVLLFFGGEVLRGFSFALVVGIVIGTYSSIFIAAPIVIDLDKSGEGMVKPELKTAKA
jgi:SecD/SecF fusion protein